MNVIFFIWTQRGTLKRIYMGPIIKVSTRIGKCLPPKPLHFVMLVLLNVRIDLDLQIDRGFFFCQGLALIQVTRDF